MNTISLDLESSLKSWAVSAKGLKAACDDVLSQYFATDASDLVDALQAAETPATVSTGLTKAQVQNMIGALEQLQKYFGNEAVTTGDYLNSLENVLHGSHPAASALSNDVEDIGEDLKSLGGQIIALSQEANHMVSQYNASGLGAAVNAVSDSTVFFGCSSTKTKLLQGIVMLANFAKYVGNEAVTTGDYYSSVLAWAS